MLFPLDRVATVLTMTTSTGSSESNPFVQLSVGSGAGDWAATADPAERIATLQRIGQMKKLHHPRKPTTV